MSAWTVFFCTASVALGALLCVAPFLLEYRAATRLTEADRLSKAVLQIENIEIISRQINHATANWQAAHEQANKAVDASREIADSIAAEARSFGDFLKKANEAEKNNLRLEVDKLRRGENEWLQILVRILDHIFALNQAAIRSGQTSLVKQLGQFQNACRDIARRVGLVPFVALPGDPYDPNTHQLADSNVVPAAAAVVAETMATGYGFQGQLVRPALVTLQTGPPPAEQEGQRDLSEGVLSQEGPHSSEAETEFAAAPVEEFPQLAPESLESSPLAIEREPLNAGPKELRR
jgi:molecular chaperone GrpE (heat shock protein)